MDNVMGETSQQSSPVDIVTPCGDAAAGIQLLLPRVVVVVVVVILGAVAGVLGEVSLPAEQDKGGYLPTDTHTDTHTHTHTHVHMHTHTHTHKHAHARTHTCTHEHTHTQTHS